MPNTWTGLTAALPMRRGVWGLNGKFERKCIPNTQTALLNKPHKLFSLFYFPSTYSIPLVHKLEFSHTWILSCKLFSVSHLKQHSSWNIKDMFKSVSKITFSASCGNQEPLLSWQSEAVNGNCKRERGTKVHSSCYRPLPVLKHSNLHILYCPYFSNWKGSQVCKGGALYQSSNHYHTTYPIFIWQITFLIHVYFI